MEKYFNNISIISALIGGAVGKYLGGWDLLLKALIYLMALDYVTGIIKGIYTKQISSMTGFRGILKKLTIITVIAMTDIVGNIIGGTVPLREIVLFFYVSNECISLIENAAVLIPIPDKLKDVLLQLREKGED